MAVERDLTAAPGLLPKRIRVPLAQVASAGGSTTATAEASYFARIFNPSRRLSCGFSVGFESKGGPVADFNSSTFTIRAFRPAGDGAEAALHVIQSSTNLPQAYEVDTSVRILQLELKLTIPKDAAAANLTGNWVLEVIWEPNVDMCLSDLERLYSECTAQLAVRELILSP